ncbi:MAG: shikimate dehydrogenase [Haliea sp.]|nr:MAG: shikimate dehydrogenase [Haliea sp.]
MINGNTELIAHIGFPTFSFKSPMIYNPYFESAGIDAVVVPFGCRPPEYPALLRALFALSNIRGALITMPHKIATFDLVDEASAAARIAGACNAVRRLPDGRLQGDVFDGEGFVRGVRRKGVQLEGASALVLGAGGVGCAIAASLAGAGIAHIALFDVRSESAHALARRLQAEYPALRIEVGSTDPAGHQVVVNATPLGMYPEDPLPLDVGRIDTGAIVGDVVMAVEMTPLLRAAQSRGCAIQVGSDMLFEQIPAYLEFFGLPTTTPDRLRALARLDAAEASPGMRADTASVAVKAEVSLHP